MEKLLSPFLFSASICFWMTACVVSSSSFFSAPPPVLGCLYWLPVVAWWLWHCCFLVTYPFVFALLMLLCRSTEQTLSGHFNLGPDENYLACFFISVLLIAIAFARLAPGRFPRKIQFSWRGFDDARACNALLRTVIALRQFQKLSSCLYSHQYGITRLSGPTLAPRFISRQQCLRKMHGAWPLDLLHILHSRKPASPKKKAQELQCWRF